MKTQILKTSVIVSVLGIGISGCNHPSVNSKIADIKDSLSQAQQNLAQDSAADEQTYKQQTEAMLNDNNNKIDSLRAVVQTERQDLRDKHNSELDTLKQRNTELQTRLTGYKETGRDKWRKFKYDLNRDIDNLGKSISRFGEKNMRKNS
jgi:uncharacterized protein HemX